VAYAIISPLLRIPAYVGVWRRTGLSPASYLHALWPALSTSIVMVLALLGIRSFMTGWPPWLGLVADVLVGGATYVGLLLTLHRTRVAEFYRQFRSVRGDVGGSVASPLSLRRSA
jgi:hypothetical protein